MPAGVVVSFTTTPDATHPPVLTSVTNSTAAPDLATTAPPAHPRHRQRLARSAALQFTTARAASPAADPLGNRTTFAYTRPAARRQPAAQIFILQRHAVREQLRHAERIATQTNANGASWILRRLPQREDDAYGTATCSTTTRAAPLVRHQDADGLSLVTKTASTASTAIGDDPARGQRTATYDTTVNPWANNVASVTRTPKPGSPLAATTTTYAYDPAYNKPSRVTGPPTTANPAGLVGTIAYDPSGNPQTVIADFGATPPHLNATTRYAYNGLGQVASVTDPNGTVSRFRYDGLGNLASVMMPAARRAPAALPTIPGDVVAATDANGNTTTSTCRPDRVNCDLANSTRSGRVGMPSPRWAKPGRGLILAA